MHQKTDMDACLKRCFAMQRSCTWHHKDLAEHIFLLQLFASYILPEIAHSVLYLKNSYVVGHVGLSPSLCPTANPNRPTVQISSNLEAAEHALLLTLWGFSFCISRDWNVKLIDITRVPVWMNFRYNHILVQSHTAFLSSMWSLFLWFKDQQQMHRTLWDAEITPFKQPLV